MTIDDAIKILKEDLNHLQEERSPDVNNAIKLGREALKAWQEHRRIMGHPKLWILPGETKD